MNMKKPVSNSFGTELPKQTRHIVTWSQEEDDILREQIRNHGTDNWGIIASKFKDKKTRQCRRRWYTYLNSDFKKGGWSPEETSQARWGIIASKFKDKTTRQCRRRWYTYLNSDFKKGGWSPEEDMLLCEAQKIFGNRWTEIAKVVSGRTDNAVKNRFSTLCKKRAKAEVLAKENNTPHINLNNKRVIYQDVSTADGLSENGTPLTKIRRNHLFNVTENCNHNVRLEEECAKMNPRVRPPLAELVQNFDTVRGLPTQNHSKITKDCKDANNDLTQGMYLKKDDPKIVALLQQAQLLSSLAVKVNTENTDQSFENAWKILQDFLNQSKDGDMIRLRISDMDFELANSKDLAEDLKSSREGSLLSWRLSDLYADSPNSSEYSTGSTLLNHVAGDNTACSAAIPHVVAEPHFSPTRVGHLNINGDVAKGILSCAPSDQSKENLKSDILPSCSNPKTDDEVICAISNSEFSSPIQLTPLFKSLASGIPSPQFSESERHFLLKTLGVDSPLLNQSTKAIQSPPCKRALLQSL